MSTTRLVVLAWGNDSRGDDALGPEFLARAQALPDPPGVKTTYVADFQLQPEHAIDLDAQDLVLFVDACRGAASPCALREVAPARTATFSTHGVAPGVVLDAYRLTYARPAPPAFELAIGGETFDLGASLSPTAHHGLDAALDLFARLRRSASAQTWRTLATPAWRFCETMKSSPPPHE